jgi:hypothetical protein
MTVTIGTAQLTGPGAGAGGVGVGSSPIAPQQIKPAIVPVRKKIYWKSSGEN